MKEQKIAGILFLVLISVVAVNLAIAVPSGPSSLTPIGSSRYSLGSGQATAALAGNVSEINLNGKTITQNWQGYYGNVTGSIVLGDSSNRTIYDWTLANPHGEVYAVRNSGIPTWASVRCANLTELNTEQTTLGGTLNDADSINNTFSNTSTFNTFYVGPRLINISSQNCYSTHLYNESGAQSVYFSEVVLSDTTANLVYTAILESDMKGFDNRTHDFEMIVGENGHGTDTTISQYYFYVEIE